MILRKKILLSTLELLKFVHYVMCRIFAEQDNAVSMALQ